MTPEEFARLKVEVAINCEIAQELVRTSRELVQESKERRGDLPPEGDAVPEPDRE